MAASHTLLVGLSGPSSSGKTTLARLLRSIFNTTGTALDTDYTVSTIILHEDDFYKTDLDIPWRQVSSPEFGTRDVQDWDCVESLDLPLLKQTLQYVKTHGSLPPEMVSKEDQNSVGETQVSEDEINSLQQQVGAWLSSLAPSRVSTTAKHVTICILDGFLLLVPPPGYLASHADEFRNTSIDQLHELYTLLHQTLDMKLFLPSTYELTLQRRRARSGYVTLEGFWEDPPGYVEDVVWPNYARDHGWLFAGDRARCDGGDVAAAAADEQAVLVGPAPTSGNNAGVRVLLYWAFALLKKEIQEQLLGRGTNNT